MNYKIEKVTDADQNLIRVTVETTDNETAFKMRYQLGEETMTDIEDYFIDDDKATFDIVPNRHFSETKQFAMIKHFFDNIEHDPMQKIANEETELKRLYSELSEAERKVKDQENTITHLNKYIDFLEAQLS